MAFYGTVSEANTYFSNRLHSDSWEDASVANRQAALTEATRVMDSLKYKGVKHSVWLIMYEYDEYRETYVKKTIDTPTRNEIIAADAIQELEFPRGQDDEVPTNVEWACYEFALALIDGFDPEDAIDRLNITHQVYASVRTTYADGSQGQEYLAYGIPNARIWMWLKPYLSDDRILRISRV